MHGIVDKRRTVMLALPGVFGASNATQGFEAEQGFGVLLRGPLLVQILHPFHGFYHVIMFGG